MLFLLRFDIVVVGKNKMFASARVRRGPLSSWADAICRFSRKGWTLTAADGRDFAYFAFFVLPSQKV